MATLGALTINLNADTAELASDLGRAARLNERFAADAVAIGATIGTVLGNAITGAASHMASMVKSAIDAADEMGKFAQKVGLGTEELTSFAVAARLADVSTATLKTGLKTLSTNAAEAVRSGGKAGEAFKAMGISLTDADGNLKSTSTLFDEVATKMARYEDSAQKTALANAVFGRSGQELIPMMNGMSGTAELARKLGSTLDKETARAAEKFNDNLTIGKMATEAMGLTVARVLLPTLTTLSEQMVETATKTGRLEFAAKAADFGLKSIITVASVGAAVFETLAKHIHAAASSMIQFVQGNFSTAFGILSKRFDETRLEITDAMESVGRTWGAVANFVNTGAEATGKKLAAPALAAKAKVATAVKEIDHTMRDYMRRYALIEADREALIKNQTDAEDAVNKKIMERDAMLEREAAKYRDIADPQAVYVRQLEMIDELGRRGQLNADQVAASRASVYEAASRGADKMADSVKKVDDIGKQLGMTFSSAFEDMLVKGASAGEMFRALAQDVLRVFAREQITKPIAGAFSSIFNSLFSSGPIADVQGGMGAGLELGMLGLPGRATGGPMSAGRSYLVGERGPEIVTPDVSSWVTPNGGGAGGGIIFNNSYSIGSNVSRAEVVQAVEQGNARLRSQLSSELGRNGPFARDVNAAR